MGQATAALYPAKISKVSVSDVATSTIDAKAF
jgi:hypothetical protein